MEITERHCKRCDTVKPIEEFSIDKYDKSGRTYTCKKCRAIQCYAWAKNNPEKVKAANLKYTEFRKEYYNTPERKLKYRRMYIERDFGLKYSEYERMQVEQSNLCAICQQPETNPRYDYLAVDHNHNTGEVRQLLCNKCNRFLGWIKEDISILEKMINYLKKHNSHESNNLHRCI